MLNVAHQIGTTLGLALLVVVDAGGDAPVHDAAGMARQTGLALQVAALFLFCALLVSACHIRFGSVSIAR